MLTWSDNGSRLAASIPADTAPIATTTTSAAAPREYADAPTPGSSSHHRVVSQVPARPSASPASAPTTTASRGSARRRTTIRRPCTPRNRARPTSSRRAMDSSCPTAGTATAPITRRGRDSHREMVIAWSSAAPASTDHSRSTSPNPSTVTTPAVTTAVIATSVSRVPRRERAPRVALVIAASPVVEWPGERRALRSAGGLRLGDGAPALGRAPARAPAPAPGRAPAGARAPGSGSGSGSWTGAWTGSAAALTAYAAGPVLSKGDWVTAWARAASSWARRVRGGTWSTRTPSSST